MRWWARARHLWRTLVDGRRLDSELDAEVAAFLEETIARRIAAGDPPDIARRATLIEFGGVEQVKERTREVRMGWFFAEIIRDAVTAWRSLRRAPAFTVAALAILTLGVGANIAILSVAHALLVQPLPFREPDRLVFVWADQTAEGYPRAPLSGPELRDLDERATRFEGFGGIWATTAALTGDHEPEQLRIGLVTSDFFELLGAEAALGRTFRVEDESADGPTAILLSGAVWQRRYGSDATIVGRRIDVNGRPTIVVGVMPVGFRLMMPPDAAVPDDLEAWQLLNRRFAEGPRGQRYLRVIGRMKPGVQAADAVADIERTGRDISAMHAFYGAAGRRFETVPLQVDAVNDVRRPLQLLAVGSGILLLIACINVGSLSVARAASQARETAVKLALGAGRTRLVRQAQVEAVVLGICGSAAGLVLGHWLLVTLLRFTPDALGRLRLATISLPVVGVTTGAVTLWMLVTALAPASQSISASLLSTLRDGRGHTGGRARGRIHAALTVAQLALSVVLVIGALLLARAVQRLQDTDLGFDGTGVLTVRVALPASRYPNQDAFNAFSRRAQGALGSLPTVVGAAAVSHAPYDHVPNWGGPYLVTEGADASTAPQADYRAVAPGAFEMLAVRLVDGRFFTEADDPRSSLVAIVDDRLARRAWPGDVAVGRRIAVDPNVTGTPSAWATIVGVVAHVRHRTPAAEVRDQVYFSSRQVMRNPSVYAIKTTGRAEALVPQVRSAFRALDPALPIYDVRPLGQYVAEALALRSYTALLAALFGLAALMVAAAGVYGVVDYALTERRRELSLRVAVGASSVDIISLVVRDAARMATAGLGLGLGGAALAGTWLRPQLVGISPWDPAAMTGTVMVLVAAVALACAGPTRRALGADPAEVLREG